MSVLVMTAVVMAVVDIHDGSLTAGMSVLVMTAAVDMHDDSVDTFDWPLPLCMKLAVVLLLLLLRIHLLLPLLLLGIHF